MHIDGKYNAYTRWLAKNVCYLQQCFVVSFLISLKVQGVP